MCDHSRSFLQFCLEALFCIGLSWVSKDFIHYMKKLDLGLSTHWFRNLCLLAAKDKIKLINVLNKTCVWLKRLFKQYQESFKGLKLAMNQWQLSPKALPQLRVHSQDVVKFVVVLYYLHTYDPESIKISISLFLKNHSTDLFMRSAF